jgi:hypothetical protein
MKKFLTLLFFILSLFSLSFASVHAQESCANMSVDESRSAGNNSYGADDFESAIVY